ncbi:MAG: glutathione S-transferase family protein [Rhizobiales bacterium]|nr:glutathione S-transferase family protein [Hyphomicrobiales bacterium]
MIRIWGRTTSSNVQKVMWALGEMNVPCERIDAGGAFGKNKDAPYLAMNPNGLVPTLEEEDGFLLWESNSIVRYLANKHDGAIEPKDRRVRGIAQQWMDWQLSVFAPAITPVFWQLVRTPAEKRDHAAIEAGKVKSTEAARILDARLAKAQYVAGDDFSYGDIPVGIMAYRYLELVTERPAFPHLERWYAAITQRKAYQDHVGSVPLS